MKTISKKSSPQYGWMARTLLVTVVLTAFAFISSSVAAHSAEEDALALLDEGSALVQQGKYDEAIDVLTRAIKAKFPPEYDVESNYGLIYTSRGLAYFREGFVKEALADYDTAVALDPGNPDALNNRGVLKQSKGDAAGALADYSAAIATNGLLASAYINRASLLIEMKRSSEALKDLDNYILLVADNPDVYNLRGRIYLAQGKRELAAADFNRALFLAPGNRDAFLNLGSLYITSRDYSRAEDVISRVLAVNPDDAEAYLLRSKARDGLGNTAGAQADRARAKEINPNL